MPGTPVLDEIELVIGDIGRGGGGEPPTGGDGEGDGDRGDGNQDRRFGTPNPRRYATAVKLAMVSITMFFMVIVAAFLVLRNTSDKWIPLHLPAILWLNTAVLLCSSGTMELARKRLALANLEAFQKLWLLTTALGFLFVAGQLVAWFQLLSAGILVASTQASSFFYVITGLHGLHLLGGLFALLYVAFRKSDKGRLSVSLAAELVSYYWHFMDGLWVFLFLLLSFGK
jgi:cytochrome c oxidase subunit III